MAIITGEWKSAESIFETRPHSAFQAGFAYIFVPLYSADISILTTVNVRAVVGGEELLRVTNPVTGRWWLLWLESAGTSRFCVRIPSSCSTFALRCTPYRNSNDSETLGIVSVHLCIQEKILSIRSNKCRTQNPLSWIGPSF